MSEQQKAKLLYEESDLRGLYDALTAAHAQKEELREAWLERRRSLEDDIGELIAREEGLRKMLYRAEYAARAQENQGNEGDADAIRRDAMRSALGLGIGESLPAIADQGASPVKCPDCYGKGLTDQDDGLGILLNVDGSTTECRTCRGSGVASSGKDKAKGAINDWSF